MTVEEAIISALDYEVKVRDYYADAAAKTDDPKGREIFQALAEEEQGHVDHLNGRLKKLRMSGKLEPEEIKSLLPSKEWIEQGNAKMTEVSLDRSYDTEIQMMKDALKLEEEVSDHYKKLVSQLDGDAQAMFRRFLEIEDGHTAIVQAELDALQGNGFWFDFAEFNLEAG